MAREIIVNLSDTINGWRVKTNSIAHQIGDLDNLQKTGFPDGSSGFTGHDSDIVQALNRAFNQGFIDSNEIKEHHIATGVISLRNMNVTGDSTNSAFFLKSDGDGTFSLGLPATTNYSAGNGIGKNSVTDSGGAFSVAAGSGLTQDADGLSISAEAITDAMLSHMAAHTVKVNATAAAADPTNLTVSANRVVARGNSGSVSDLQVQTLMIAEDAVTYARMQEIVTANRVLGKTTAGDIEEVQVVTAMIATDGVETDNIKDINVTTAKIANDAVTYTKIQDIVTANRVLGRTSVGEVEETLVYADMLAANAVTTDKISAGKVTNVKLANMAGNTVKVRAASTAGVPSDIAVGNAQILIGNGAGFTAATLSGDCTISNAGVVTLASGDVSNSTNADNINVDEKNDNVNYQVLFSDNNGSAYQRPYIDQDNGHLMYNPSTHTLTAGTFAGRATSANYADLAEKYTTSEEHVIGTVMMVSSSETEETTRCLGDGIPMGVVSADPAYLMNASIDGQALALKGRVPVRIVGAVNKGDPVYAHHNGCAGREFPGHAIVGIALESSVVAEEKLIECVLKV